MKKKILAMALVIVMIAIMLTSFTMAYFTDNEKAVNAFTVGNIDIELTEDAKVLDEEGKVVYANKCVTTADGATYSNLMPGNKIVKAPTIKNVSTNGNAAYVRVVVTMNNVYELNRAIDDVYEVTGYDPADVQKVYDKVFDGWGINYNPRGRQGVADDARGIIESHADKDHVLKVDFTKTSTPVGHNIFGLNNWFKSAEEIGTTGGDPYEVTGASGYVGYYTNGMTDGQFRWVYYIYLPAGESVTLFNGLNVPAEFDNNATDMNGNPVDQMAFFKDLTISIKADAIQAEGFAKNGMTGEEIAKAAFEALQAAHPIA